ncbi:MFS transporter [Colwellia sp. UCD-KL20]|uniref:MFS transporter n=1 Tax=Colwellia sp. UCD-KL20 TaxID=1917165 RepID=UPI0025704BA3|nr:MFS transporter [Colwellia sp. UCD-KL20]
MSVFFMRNGIWVLATPFFQMTLGVDPFLLSLSITIPLFIALFLGPFIGQLSDSMYRMRGTRDPLLITAALVCGISYGLLWMIPSDLPQEKILIYIFLLALIFQLFSSVYIIPLTSLMYEVSDDSYQRTRTLGFIAYYNKVCSILYHWAFPLAQLSLFGSLLLGVKVVGWFIGCVLIALLGMFPVWLLKNSQVPLKQNIKATPKVSRVRALQASLACVFGNTNFGLLMLVVLCQTCISGFSASMDYYLIVYYMFGGDVVEGAFWKGILSSSYSAMGFIAIPIITLTVKRFGNKKTLEIVFLFTMLGGLCKWFIFTPGNEWLLPFDAVLSSSVWLSMFVIIPSMIADLSEANRKETHLDRKGSFISIHTLGGKLGSAIAVICSGLALNLIGFDASSITPQTPDTLLSMRVILTFGTVLSSLTAFILIKKIKI